MENEMTFEEIYSKSGRIEEALRTMRDETAYEYDKPIEPPKDDTDTCHVCHGPRSACG